MRRRFIELGCSQTHCASYLSERLGRRVSSSVVSSIVNGATKGSHLEPMIEAWLDSIEANGGADCPYCSGTGKRPRARTTFFIHYHPVSLELSDD